MPETLAPRCIPGVRVLVPFGKRRLTGYVVGASADENPRATRSIEHVLDETPVFNSELLQFASWMADYYLCPLGDVLKAALPAGITLDESRYWTLTEHGRQLLQCNAPHEDENLRAMLSALTKSPLSGETVRRRFRLESSSSALRKLRNAGLIDYRPVLKPPTVRTRYEAVLTLTETSRSQYDTSLFTHTRSVHQQQLLRELHDHEPDGVPRGVLLKGATTARRTALTKLIESGLVESRMEEVNRWNPDDEAVLNISEPSQLTGYQTDAISQVSSAVRRSSREVFLLFGVTGSGKTQVYIESIRATLAMGRTALLLLPEIALTPFVWARFRLALGDRVAIQHSAQSPAVRYDLWKRIGEGVYPVVIGARSAVFAPLANLGLVVVDEEQESSYKQAETDPRYHARDAALMRARLAGAVTVLGSATPSAESMHHALQGKYRLLELPERVGGAVMPRVEVVSWKPPVDSDEAGGEVAQSRTKGERKIAEFELPAITGELAERIEHTLSEGKQILILQNRRGFSPFLICKICGHLFTCPNCSVSLTYHRKGRVLRCHYCDHRDGMPERCPECGAAELSHYGLGTQKLEDELRERFPAARILRMDSDSVLRQGEHGRMVTAFAHGEYDILVGTQMVAKGLDFPGVELAAVARADSELFFPDFRATERGASLILQLSGRAGRRERPGTVIIQSAVPNHPAIATVISGDWRALIERELTERARSGFPPHTRLILIRAVSRDESGGIKALLKVRRYLVKTDKLEILGPAPAIVLKVEQMFRFNMLVRTWREKDPSGAHLRGAVKGAVTDYMSGERVPGVKLEVDVDPVSVV